MAQPEEWLEVRMMWVVEAYVKADDEWKPQAIRYSKIGADVTANNYLKKGMVVRVRNSEES